MRDGSSRRRHPLPRSTVTALPPVLANDLGTSTLARSVDTMLAPVIEVLDDLDAYIEPGLAPEDWVDWLIDWPGLPVSDRMSADTKRAMLQKTGQIGGHLGTAQGVVELLSAATRGSVAVRDNGGVAWVDGPTTRAERASVEIQVDGAEADRVIAGQLAAELVPLGTDWRVV